MNKTYGLLVVIISMALASFAYAQEVSSCDDTDKITHIYYVNGINNSLAEATLSKNALFYAYMVTTNIRNMYPNEEFKYLVAYNNSRGFIKDILEVINQKVTETGGLTAEELLYLIKLSKQAALQAITELSTASGGGRIVVNLAVKAVDAASDAYLDRLEEDANSLSRYYEQETTDEHIQKYTSDLAEGKRVLVVAHSQGNLFANKAVETVITRNAAFINSIGIVGVANPAGILIGNNEYVTAHDDRVIDALRITHNVLPSNIDNDPGIFNDERDIFNHNFMTSYLASEMTPEYALGNTLPSRGRINSMFIRHIRNLQYPIQESGRGAIKVSLVWGTEPDVDLHVYEPNNTHVYYMNRFGTYGFLDRDDVDGEGPETYFVACEDMAEGRYRIGVNYFRGSNPETAKVQITTGDGRTQSNSKRLSTAVGTSGNDIPVPVADVYVTTDQYNKYKYQVILH